MQVVVMGGHLINYKQTPVDHTLDCCKIRLSLSNPSLDAPKVATSVFCSRVEDDLVTFALPFHGGEIGMALQCLSDLVYTMTYRFVWIRYIVVADGRQESSPT